jgi:hypothetical protein
VDDVEAFSDEDYSAWWDSWYENGETPNDSGDEDWSGETMDETVNGGGGDWTGFLQKVATGALQNRWDTERNAKQNFNGSTPALGPNGVPAQPGFANIGGVAVPRWVVGVGLALGVAGGVWAVAHALSKK